MADANQNSHRIYTRGRLSKSTEPLPKPIGSHSFIGRAGSKQQVQNNDEQHSAARRKIFILVLSDLRLVNLFGSTL
jgi:hypothetical protein